jgi:multiple sugar transport system permease protein
MNKTHLSRAGRERLIAYSFLLPNFIGFLVFVFVPVIIALVLSFMKWDSSNPASFVGMENFRQLFTDSNFRISLLNTFYFTLTEVPITIGFALVLAVLLNQGIRGTNIFRVLHFIPYISSVVAISVVWQLLYHPTLGLINNFLFSVGVKNPPRWLADVKWAMPSVILMSVWKSIGYYVIIFLAGLQTVPKDLYEAAEIDGAGTWKQFIHVTVPLLSPTTFFALIMCIINSFKIFDQIYMLTQGGPGNATSMLVYYIYKQGFVNFRFGYASAIAMVLFLIIFIFTMIQFRLQKKWVNY